MTSRSKPLNVLLSTLLLASTAGVVVASVSTDVAGAAVQAHDDHADDSGSDTDVPGDNMSGSSSDGETTHQEHGMIIHDSTGGREPTDEDQQNADAFYDDVVAGIAEYQNIWVALEDGYVAGPASEGKPIKHFMKRGTNGALLDPEHPSGLVYYVDDNQATLLGAVYVTRADTPPQPGGPLTVWHDHSLTNCPDGHPQCPGDIDGDGMGDPTLMFHVWTFGDAVDPFAHSFPGAVGRANLVREPGERPRLPFDV